ncbi:hypothetical protein [Streptomyces sp. TP-A0356]|uniref:hypothetical protein n=1 Tax=Streptomyces sp. TP-A0356 TaxID=1359208 RepID=UPI0006E42355|nr:hypothetical protein [Streptomyces sp. TP-A0356]
MRTTARITAFLTGAVLLTTAACSGDSGTGHAKGAKKDDVASSVSGHQQGSTGADAGPAKTLGKKRLDQVVIEGTVAGYKVSKLADRDIPLDGGYSVNRKECAPIGALIGGHLPVKPAGEVYRTVRPVDAKNATVGNVWLSAYGSEQAGRVVDTLGTAVDMCKGSFTTAGLTYHSVERIGPARPGEVAFRVTGDVGKQQITMNYRVVRAGTVVAGFYGVNMLHPKDGTISDAVVDAQLERLSNG